MSRGLDPDKNFYRYLPDGDFGQHQGQRNLKLDPDQADILYQVARQRCLEDHGYDEDGNPYFGDETQEENAD